MTVFKCFFPQVRQLRRGLLEEQEREQENRVSIAFLSEIIKKDSKMCCVVQIELCVFRRADPVLRLASSRGKCFYYTILDILETLSGKHGNLAVVAYPAFLEGGFQILFFYTT